MSIFKSTDPLPENINRSNEHPLFNFASLAITVSIIFVVIFFLLFLVGNIISKTVSMDNEYKYLNSFFAKKIDIENGEFYKLTNDLWQRNTGNTNVEFNPSVISGEPNAFIIPGGKIFLTEGFLKQTGSENELSFVLCHELGHFFKRHTIASLATQIAMGIFQASLGASEVSVPGISQVFVRSSFSRKQETEADEFALECLNNKYGHVNGYSHFFEKIKKIDKRIFQNKYFSTHPITEERINHLRQVLIQKEFKEEGSLIAFSFRD